VFAIISDIHGNFEALNAVVNDIGSQGIDRVFCLGDVVGYGPQPAECIDLVRKMCEVCLCGNHDYALVYGATGFNAVAADAINYHRNILMPQLGGKKRDDAPLKRWTFLKDLLFRYMEEDILFVHGSPRNPINEYITETDVKWGLERKIHEIFSLVERICFIGHTHRPGILNSKMEFLTTTDVNDEYQFPTDHKAVINVGSIGQPRDGDPRACYAIVDNGVVRFRRVPYDVEAVCRKIQETGLLDESLAERLKVGK